MLPLIKTSGARFDFFSRTRLGRVGIWGRLSVFMMLFVSYRQTKLSGAGNPDGQYDECSRHRRSKQRDCDGDVPVR
jgi:hypothetical protein